MANKKFITKEEFINTISDTISDTVKEFGNATIMTLNKADKSYTGLVIKKVNTPSPVINLDRLYMDYCNGVPLDECVNTAKDILNMKANLPIRMDELLDWDIVKDRLYLRLVGNIVDNTIYQKAADMYLVPYISISEERGMTTKVISQMIEKWKVSEEEVFEQAKRNQTNLRPVKIENLAERLGFPDELPLFVVSTESGCCGASAILYDGVPERIRDMLGEFYILPSSIHETIVIPKEDRDIEELRDLVAFVNDTEVADDEVLTNSVYTYDFNTNELIKVA